MKGVTFNEEDITRIKELRRARAIDVTEDLLDDDWEAAKSHHKDDEGEANDNDAFDLNAEDAQGHYDEDGYFLFDHRTRSIDRKIIWGDKEGRERLKRKLGIDDEDAFVEKKLRKLDEPKEKLMKVRSDRSLNEKEYSDDEDDEMARTRDSWLDGLDEGAIREVKQTVVERKQQESEALERKLENRFGASLTKEDQLKTLIDLLETPKQSPADLMRLIKDRDGINQGSQQRSEGKKVKKTQRPRRLSPEAQSAMDTLVDLCDQLTMEGLQVITESKSTLQSLLAKPSLAPDVGSEDRERNLYDTPFKR